MFNDPNEAESSSVIIERCLVELPAAVEVRAARVDLRLDWENPFDTDLRAWLANLLNDESSEGRRDLARVGFLSTSPDVLENIKEFEESFDVSGTDEDG